MNFLKRIFCKCKETERFTRWIAVCEKKNKPEQDLLEVLDVCTDCSRIARSGYFTEDEIKLLTN